VRKGFTSTVGKRGTTPPKDVFCIKKSPGGERGGNLFGREKKSGPERLQGGGKKNGGRENSSPHSLLPGGGVMIEEEK